MINLCVFIFTFCALCHILGMLFKAPFEAERKSKKR